MDNTYQVHLESFEGPLDLLLHLIEKNRINIYDIPISLLTEQYMAYLNKFREFNIDIASEFLVMATTLLQIKSKMLLPDTQTDEETAEEDENIDPRQELVERLLEYRRYKQVSAILSEMADEAGQRFFRKSTLNPPKHLPPTGLSIKALLKAFQNALGQIENEPLVANVAKEQFNIENQIIYLLKSLKAHNGNMSFYDAFSGQTSKDELITTFLAMLELIKMKRISVYQTDNFSPIYLKIIEET